MFVALLAVKRKSKVYIYTGVDVFGDTCHIFCSFVGPSVHRQLRADAWSFHTATHSFT